MVRKDFAAPDIGLKHNEMAKIDRKKDGRQELLLHSSHFLCKQKKNICIKAKATKIVILILKLFFWKFKFIS